MELVHHDVIERIGRKPLQVSATAEGLNRREDDLAVQLLRLARVMTQRRTRAQATEGVNRLIQDFLAMGHEQHATELRAVRIERR